MNNRCLNTNRSQSLVLLYLNQETTLTQLLHLFVNAFNDFVTLNYISCITYYAEKKWQIIGPDLNIKTQATTNCFASKTKNWCSKSLSDTCAPTPLLCDIINTHTWELIALGQCKRDTQSNPLLPSATHSKEVLRPCASMTQEPRAEARDTVKEPSSSEVTEIADSDSQEMSDRNVWDKEDSVSILKQ